MFTQMKIKLMLRHKWKHPKQKSSITSPDSTQGGEPKQDNQQQKSIEQETVDLETAYKREFAFLEAQKRELTERLNRFSSSANQEEQELSQSVKSLERSSGRPLLQKLICSIYNSSKQSAKKPP